MLDTPKIIQILDLLLENKQNLLGWLFRFVPFLEAQFRQTQNYF